MGSEIGVGNVLREMAWVFATRGGRGPTAPGRGGGGPGERRDIQWCEEPPPGRSRGEDIH
eukprot:scaffold1629_cov369-Prasinococcus_capsulatus_cf.AAC.7